MLSPDRLREVLQMTFPVARIGSGGKNVVVRCMYCGDAVNPNHAHLGINLGYNETPVMFNCFKCGASGLVSRDVLVSWGVYDPEILSEVISHNKITLSLAQNLKYRSYKRLLKNEFIRNHEISKRKLEYINQRLGVDLGFSDMPANKIILNLKDLLQSNYITTFTRHDNIIEQLDQHFVGFISNDNCYVNLRKIDDEPVHRSIDNRYILYNIFNNFDNTEKFYTIPSNVNLDVNKPVRINISEGSFDILSVMYNLNSNDRAQSINSAICGSSFYTLFKLFQCRYGFIDIELHTYRDNDGKSRGLDYLYEKLLPLQIPYYDHVNVCNKEKDFGVPRYRIDEKITQLI
jgi:hypothetical protein